MFVSGVVFAQVPFASLGDGETIPAPALAKLKAASKHDIGLAPVPKKDGLKSVPGAKVGSGKPWVLYIGAGFCPYCAAMRWPLVVALMRFGTFTDLKATRSSAEDVYPNTATFSFADSSYHSQWLDLEAVETADRNRHRLQKPTSSQLARLKRYDREPYTKYPGAIPFIDIDDHWILVGSPVSPALLKGMSWYDVATHLETGKGPLWKAVMGQADQLTRKLCVLTHGKPKSTCGSLR